MLLLEFFWMEAMRHELVHGSNEHSSRHWLGYVYWEVSRSKLGQRLTTHSAGRCEMVFLVGDHGDGLKRFETLTDCLADCGPFCAEGRAVGAILDVTT